MKIKGIIAIILLMVLLAFSASCNIGSANIKLKGVSLGTLSIDQKPIEGLPSDKIDLLLSVPTQEITIEHVAGSTIITLKPSGATLEIKEGVISIKGTKPEQIKVEWAVSPPD